VIFLFFAQINYQIAFDKNNGFLLHLTAYSILILILLIIFFILYSRFDSHYFNYYFF
jgi:hypothetical protein